MIDGEARRHFTISRWVAQKRLDRDSTGGNLLRPSDSLLRAETHPLPSQAGETRRHVLWIAASAETHLEAVRGLARFLREHHPYVLGERQRVFENRPHRLSCHGTHAGWSRLAWLPNP